MKRRRRKPETEGIALIMVLVTIAVLAIVLADMHENVVTHLNVSSSARDRVQAEYLAKSSLNLTRLMVATEPTMRGVVGPIYRALLGRAPPQLPIWRYADAILQPFCNYSTSQEAINDSGFDMGNARGFGDLPGTCAVTATAENSKLNVNAPHGTNSEQARKNTAVQLFAMMGGYQSPSPYDALFGRRDSSGDYASRQDVISSVIDWWDINTSRAQFDPGAGTVSEAGSEDNPYSRYEDSYEIKNAPFDSIEELRLVRGIDDDFWATFVEPVPNDLDARSMTIYGSGAVNPNEAPPRVLLARFCPLIQDQPLCADPEQGAKFSQLLNTARALYPVPFFSKAADFRRFLEGKGGDKDLYPILRAMLGEDNPLLFTPITLQNATERSAFNKLFGTKTKVISAKASGTVGRSKVNLSVILNFDSRWTPPPPNAGRMPKLGVLHYYRTN